MKKFWLVLTVAALAFSPAFLAQAQAAPHDGKTSAKHHHHKKHKTKHHRK